MSMTYIDVLSSEQAGAALVNLYAKFSPGIPLTFPR
jgi:hypothetical protein